MDINQMKRAAAEAALAYIETGDIVGVGSGSTANFFIDGLAGIKGKIDGCVASSEATARRLRSHGIALLDLNQVGTLPVYVDGADEATKHLHLIKGGGGALTREKIVAQASEKFVCIADSGKLVAVLGEFPLPVEGDSDGAEPGGARPRRTRRPARTARRVHQRQRQYNHRCA